jgi:hypothetical protein
VTGVPGRVPLLAGPLGRLCPLHLALLVLARVFANTVSSTTRWPGASQ